MITQICKTFNTAFVLTGESTSKIPKSSIPVVLKMWVGYI